MKLSSQTSLRDVFFDLIKNFWPRLILASVCLLINHLLVIQIPFLAKELVDNVQNAQMHYKVPYWNYFGLMIGIILFRTLSRYHFFYPARIHQRDAKLYLMNLIEKTYPGRYESYNSGQLFQILQTDFDYIRALLGFVFLQVVNIFFALTVILPRLINFGSDYLFALTPLLITLVIFAVVMIKMGLMQKEGMRLQGEVQNFLMECYAGKKTINNFQKEDSFSEIFAARSEKELNMFNKVNLGRGPLESLSKLGLGLSIIWGAWITSHNSLGVSSLVMFTGVVYLIEEPLSFATWIGFVTQNAVASWKRIQEFLLKIEKETPLEMELKSEESFQNTEVGFRLTLPFWEMKLQLEVPLRGIILILGDTGIGKSTILKYVSQIFINQKISIDFVHQTPYLYSDNIENNLFLGLEKSKRNYFLALQLCKIFRLDDFQAKGEEIFQVEIGEKGKKLSGGQAKRLSLVRSLLNESEVLIWDDPFQSIDSLLEKEIMNELKKIGILNNKLLMMTSHRVTSMKYAEKYFLLNQSGFVEIGPTQNLSSSQSCVYDFFKKQLV